MLFPISPLLLLDGYKTDHRRQYPEGTEQVTSNLTPRKSRIDGFDEVVFFGNQYFLQKYLIDDMREEFFDQDESYVVDKYQAVMDQYLGMNSVSTKHIAELHQLGYLPLEIRALPEGTRCPIGVPMLTIENTDPRFFWLTNQLETLLSCCLWSPCTAATLAYRYRKTFDRYNLQTGIPFELGKYQGHDFSFRGMSSVESALTAGAGHLTSFAGTDTIPTLLFIEEYYSSGLRHSDLIGCSVPATEHSVMCMGGMENEIETYRRLITKVYPTGIVSIVSDTWDFWSLMTIGLDALYDDIVKRQGKVVFRPDSGDPVKIICGDPEAAPGSAAWKGAFQLLWDKFGGTEHQGFKHLHPKVGLIYGDSITPERQEAILGILSQRGFAPNVVLGIGSYTYQYKSRDTFGFAVKATHGVVDGEDRMIFKSPKTDPTGEKKSLKGRVGVFVENNKIVVRDQLSLKESRTGLLKQKFCNGNMTHRESLADVRYRLHGESF